MTWREKANGEWVSDDYTITRDHNYNHLLTHTVTGPIRKYRLLWGAQREAERRAGYIQQENML